MILYFIAGFIAGVIGTLQLGKYVSKKTGFEVTKKDDKRT